MSDVVVMHEARSSLGVVNIQYQAERARELIRGLDPHLQSAIAVEHVPFDIEKDGASTFLLRGRVPADAPDGFEKQLKEAINKIAEQCEKAFPIDDSSLPALHMY